MITTALGTCDVCQRSNVDVGGSIVVCGIETFACDACRNGDEPDTSEPCTATSRRAGCTCSMESVSSASIDPPEPVINLNCPLHGNAAARDPDYARDLAMEDER